MACNSRGSVATAGPSGTVGAPDEYRGLDLSPDGSRLAAHRHLGSGGDIWLSELGRGTASRFTFDATQENVSPIWSPDGSAIVFGSFRGGKYGLYRKPSNGAGKEERLLESDTTVLPTAWSPDGLSIVYHSNALTNFQLWRLPLDGDRKPVSLAPTKFTEISGQVSPDSRWMAYRSNESGFNEVYVRAFPTGAGKWQISTGGGGFPRWRRDGLELYYLSASQNGKLTAVDVKTAGTTFEFGVPRPLFDSNYINLSHATPYHPYAVSPDGQRFLIPRPPPNAPTQLASPPVIVVLNWAQGLRN
jgi:Tol biopolymer transport system component